MPCIIFLLSIIVAAAASDEPLSTGLRPRKADLLWIVNGKNARLGQFPWQSWIECIRYNFRSTGCGGSLITARHVLTAAHCVDRILLCKVSLGLISLKDDGVSYFVYPTNIAVHKGYDNYANDIAVIRLRTPVQQTENIRPIRLATESQNRETLSGASAVISGWGKTRSDDSSVSDYLQYAHVTIMPHGECQAFYLDNFNFMVGNGQICTNFSSTNVCNGDSGGPLSIMDEDKNSTLIGVVSLGVSPCEDGAPSVFTEVASYLSWINQHTNP